MPSGSWTRKVERKRLHYILIDHENVQPADLAGLGAQDACVWVFTGTQQKVAISLIEAVQALGERGRFVRISGAGKNALDFHIAYYLGHFVARDPQAKFLIVAADGGYDPLIAHLNAQGVEAKRIPLPSKTKAPSSAEKAPVAKQPSKPATTKQAAKKAASNKPKAVSITVDPAPKPKPLLKPSDQRAANGKAGCIDAKADGDKVLMRLADMTKNLPSTEASLRRMMGTWLSKDAKRLDAVIAELKKRNAISAAANKLTYRLPKS